MLRYLPVPLLLIALITSSLFLTSPTWAEGKESELRSQAINENSTSHLAAGDFLTFSIKLLNFGSSARVDVNATYKILDSQDKVVTTQTETVAVETTANFVKRMQLPNDISAGDYTLQASINYPGQSVPAVSEFEFVVEDQIFGIFKDTFIFLCVGAAAISLSLLLVARLLARLRRRRDLGSFNYSDKPRGQRVFYEIISNTITQMRLRVGDRTLEIAETIPHLQIDPDNGKVLAITGNPSKIMALLVLRYETLLGQKVDFSAPAEHNPTTHEIQKNINMVRKYFE